MAKGISLDEFKNQLDTDAQQRCTAQEKTIKDLYETVRVQEKTIKDLSETIVGEEDSIRILQNRCRSLSSGFLCDRCGMRNTCKSQNGLNMGDRKIREVEK